ncbi:MAG: hypothetical protein MR433_02160, partial [Coriobacteriaceae bacterium]|nr:hypothetical protein [Coriobacteriaceae bacterium]
LEELATTKLQLAVHVVGALNHKDPSLFNELMANKGAPTVCSPQVKGKCDANTRAAACITAARWQVYLHLWRFAGANPLVAPP